MKRLADLFRGTSIITCRGDLNVPVTGIDCDSRKIEEGDCYCSIKGFKKDGIEFLPEAISRGARAVITVHSPNPRYRNIVWVQVANDRKVLSMIASQIYDNPSHTMKVVGVTGTNGKTTTVSLIHALLNPFSHSLKMGTLGVEYRNRFVKTSLTTPEAPEIFKLMAEAQKAGCKNAVMEVSSVALSLYRVADINFSQGIFTSFSGDHIDFHRSMNNYFEAKLSLFKKLDSESWAVINIDDPKGEEVIRQLNCRYITYGFTPGADITPETYQPSLNGIRAQLNTPRGKIKVESALLGRINLLNVMAAVGSCLIFNVGIEQLEEGLRRAHPVKGRMDVVHSDSFTVVIDYAHSDQALEQMLTSVREMVDGRIILVFGAGGARDHSKRPRMGKVAATHSDHAIVTSDNPRTEKPEKIIADILEGFSKDSRNYSVEVDRKRAIEKAIDMAKPGDLVVVAGKGHEDYQIFKNRTIHFDDFEIVRNRIKELNV